MMATATTSYPPSWVRGRLIGRGSYGTVSLGFHRATGLIFAVKSVELGSSPDRIHSLETEIEILRSLDYSRYVVQYLGDDVECSHRNLHLELLPGGTVTDAAVAARRRDGSKFFDEGTVKSHTRCLVSALRHVHSRGIVHCDVKGRNVMVAQDPMVAKLADFGSAIRKGSRSEPRGSPLWMAPEVVRGEYQGPESDVWSLGCTVIEMVTGRPAWVDKGAETLSRIGFSDELPELPGELSDQGRDFIDKCLRRDREERWSCDQLLQHPFVASEMAALSRIDSSPRCVLDLVSSEFEEDIESESDEEEERSTPETEPELCARGRVMELSLCDGDGDGHGGGGPAWESDGWVEVRGGPAAQTRTRSQLIDSNTARDGDACCCRCWEYADLERADSGTSSEHCGTSGAERERDSGLPEYLNGSGGREQVEGKWRWRSCQRQQHGTHHLHPSNYLAVTVTVVDNYNYNYKHSHSHSHSLCNFLLFLPYLLLLYKYYYSREDTKRFVSHYFTCAPFSFVSLALFPIKTYVSPDHKRHLRHLEFCLIFKFTCT